MVTGRARCSLEILVLFLGSGVNLRRSSPAARSASDAPGLGGCYEPGIRAPFTWAVAKPLSRRISLSSDSATVSPTGRTAAMYFNRCLHLSRNGDMVRHGGFREVPVMPKHRLMLVFVAAVLVGSVGGISAQIRGIHFDVTEFIKVTRPQCLNLYPHVATVKDGVYQNGIKVRPPSQRHDGFPWSDGARTSKQLRCSKRYYCHRFQQCLCSGRQALGHA